MLKVIKLFGFSWDSQRDVAYKHDDSFTRPLTAKSSQKQMTSSLCELQQCVGTSDQTNKHNEEYLFALL